MKPVESNRFFSALSVAMIFISSVLLAIWSIKNTIALRNILLISGVLIGLLILKNNRRLAQLISNRPTCSQFTPLILAACMFIWVLLHFLFFSQDEALQIQELRSTWLRVLQACFIGGVTGLIVGTNLNRSKFLWLGIFSSFLYLLFDYILAHIDSGLFFMPDYYFSSPFGNKINTVLMGNIYIAAICGSSAYALTQNLIKLHVTTYLYWLVGVIAILFCFTTVIDTRNGIGVALILIGAWLLYIGAIALKHQFEARKFNTKAVFITAIPLLLIIFFIQQHLSINRGWIHFVDDISLAVQIKDVPNWQDIKKYGYPRLSSGEMVYPNNYERAAWATAGIESISLNPLGYGLLEHSLGRVIRQTYPESVIQSSHSAWIDYGLAFGLPGLIFTLGALASILKLAIKSRSPNRQIAAWITMGLLITFTVAEVSSKHAIEILFFCIGLLNTMLLAKSSEKFE